MTAPVEQQVALVGTQGFDGLDIVVHGIVREAHEIRTTTTQYPIESGSEVTEHAVRRPAKLTISGWVAARQTRTEQVEREGVTVSVSAEAVDHSVPVSEWVKIVTALDDHSVFNAVTLLGVYPNMSIRKATAQLDERSGQNLPFVLELEEVQTSPTVGGIGEADPAPDSEAADRQTQTSRGVTQVESRGSFVGGDPGGTTVVTGVQADEPVSAPVTGNEDYGVLGNESFGVVG